MNITPFEQDHLTQIKLGMLYSRDHGFQLPSNNFWNTMEIRRKLNQPRFDFWHPHIGRLICRAEEYKCTTNQPVCHNPKPPVCVTPEPSSIILFGLAILVGICYVQAKKIRSTSKRAGMGTNM